MANHIWVKHEHCESLGCMICDGGLSLCQKCGLIEGSLTTECPEVEAYSKHGDKIYNGQEDFIGGKWVEGAISIYSPFKYRKKK